MVDDKKTIPSSHVELDHTAIVKEEKTEEVDDSKKEAESTLII